MDPAIEIRIDELTFEPEEKSVLKEIYKTVNKGDFVAITGKPSCGKSMLLHAITGAAEKFFDGKLSGNVRIHGLEVKDIPLPNICDHAGYMMQSPQNQVVSTTVGEEIAFGLANMNLPWSEIQRRTRNVLEFVGLENMEERSTDQLSGGQSQRVVFASIMAMETPILILDQPAAELDASGRKELYSYIGHLNKTKQVTVVMVMDRAGDILPYANRVWIMEDGRIKEECAPKAYEKTSMEPKKSMAPAPTFGDVHLELKDLCFSYKGLNVGCKNIHASVRQGEFVALVGLNGSGKSTTMKLIEGLLSPDRGSVELFGEPMTKKSASSIRRKMGFVFQDPDMQIFSDSVYEELSFGLKARGLADEEIQSKATELLEKFQLAEYMHQHPHKLSRSQRQKLAIATALITMPEILLADEPTSGLDDGESDHIMELFSSFQRQGNTVMLVTHDLDLAFKYSNRVLVLHEGRLVLDIPTKELFEHRESLLEAGLEFGREEEWSA